MKKLLAISIVAMLLSCNAKQSETKQDGKEQAEQETVDYGIKDVFDASEVPCGTIIGGEKPTLFVRAENGKVYKVRVPEWVWDASGTKVGEDFGNCEDSTAAE